MPFKFGSQQNEQLDEQLETQQSGNWLTRNVIGTLARGLEGFGGKAGNLAELGLSGLDLLRNYKSPVSKLHEKARGVPRYSNSENVYKLYEDFNKEVGFEDTLKSVLPSTQNLRKLTQKLTGQALEPQSQAGQSLQNVSETFGQLLSGGVTSPMRALGIAGAGELSGKGAKALGLGSTGQAIAQTGGQILASLKGGRSALQADTNKKYDVSTALAEGKSGNGSIASKAAEKVFERYENTNSAFGKRVKDEALSVKNIIDSKGNIDFGKAINRIKDINNLMYKEGAPAEFKVYLTELKNSIGDTIKNSNIPGLADNYSQAQAQYSILKKPGIVAKGLNKLSDYAASIFPDFSKFVKTTTKYGIPIGIAAGAKSPFGMSSVKAAGVGLTAVNEASKFYNTFMQSPVAREAYYTMIQEAALGNIQTAQKNIKTIQQEYDRLNEQEEQQSKPTTGFRFGS